MHPQIIPISNNNQLGVFIPIEDWNMIKREYPDIENINDDIPEWHKELLNERLAAIEADPSRVKPMGDLFKRLRG